MKGIGFYIVFLCFCAFAKAQNTPAVASIDAITFKLGVGEYQEVNDIEITFLEVLEDSRCPKDVDCVWAGQAKIKIAIKEKGKKTIEKEVVMDASGKDVVIYTSDTTVIKATYLSPYPKTSTAISNRVYYLELQV